MKYNLSSIKEETHDKTNKHAKDTRKKIHAKNYREGR